MTTQGGKKTVKKDPATAKPPAARKPRARAVKEPEVPVGKIKRAETLADERRLESLAMIQHVHGQKIRRSGRRPFFKLTRMDHIVETNWSLWHLAWAVLWRIALMAFMIRLLASITAIYLSGIISR
jgi:hypothetical protein